jgi:hypothetical protein
MGILHYYRSHIRVENGAYIAPWETGRRDEISRAAWRSVGVFRAVRMSDAIVEA